MEHGLFYLNKPQRYAYELLPRKLTGVMARRLGKTFGFGANYLEAVTTLMPRGKTALYCATLKQGLTRTIPETIHGIESTRKWIHGVHFFVGNKAPKAAGFPEPLVRPFNWEHCIHWWTGHVTHILSQDIKFSANSLTLDGYLIDEARNIRKQKVDEELVPALSGSPGMFNDCPLKKSEYILSDRPITREGQWVLDREQLATPEIEQQLLEEIRLYAYAVTNNKPKWMIAEIMKEINRLRTQCHLYKEYDTIDNLAVVGEDYIADMKRTLPLKIFNISILNIRQKRATDGFYSAFDSERHTYVVDTANEVDNMRVVIRPTPKNRIKSAFETWDFKRLQEHNCFLDHDINPKEPLNIAFDYNANINWVVTAQRGESLGRRTMNVLGSMFVKNERKLRELCHDWANYYEPHRIRNNQVNFYYNQTAKQKGYANNNDNEKFHETITQELTARGWHVRCTDMGKAMGHMDKFFMLDDALKCINDPRRGGQKYLYPFFNKENNEFLIAALESANVLRTSAGFEKDKSGEKLADSEDDPAELRTDGTDAFDDLFIGMCKFPREGRLHIPGISF